MITKEQAMQCPSEVWHLYERNADGTPKRFRSSGQCKTWKTRPHEFKLPMKYGLYHSFYITHENAHQFVLPDEFEEQAVNLRLDGKYIPPTKRGK